MNGTVLGIDIGSTTAKIVLVENGKLIYEKYERHFSQVRSKTAEMIGEISHLIEGKNLKVAVSGSAGLGLANAAGIPFVQEVFATGETVKRLAPDTSAVIELGGEDAKIIFFEGGMEERMNGSCAGGTGAFIDQMATLLNVTNEEMDALALSYERIYPIASRCGVFAKTDIQPLLNQGALKSDVAASIYQAVVNQTIAGLAQGRKIGGKVMFLGGPLFYCKALRQRFAETLKLDENSALFPDYGRIAVAIGAAIYAFGQEKTFTPESLVSAIENAQNVGGASTFLEPLFADKTEYDAFCKRHAKAGVKTRNVADYEGDAYIGIDCGSTTTKLVLISADCDLLYSFYDSNKGNPVGIVRDELLKIYGLCGDRITIKGSAVTGYGEELIKNAFDTDGGLVETMAHFTAAKFFNPKVDFILDIGGQDIKCFKIRNNSIDSIMLNEACSSGCGSFIETFAKSMGYSVEDFAAKGLFAARPVDLGSRCTVFMNSSVKQAQKDGATVEDISAGLSISVVRNAIYKVIRATSPDELGKNIVVQGGTFLNDAVLRGFETVIGREVVRPEIAGLMGAFGAALYARGLKLSCSTTATKEALQNFTHTAKAASCKGCTNNCRITVNTFSSGKRFVSGNQCERGAGIKLSEDRILPNLYAYKRDKIEELSKDEGENVRGTVGLPLALGMYELLPLWHAVFKNLGFRVVVSGASSRELYQQGQYSIPSDTACYPAKIMHGHIEKLLSEKVDAIFYPCLTYNVDEKSGDNHYNCPVVAYYSELLSGNMESLQATRFIYPYLNINNKKELTKGLYLALGREFSIKKDEIKRAVEFGLDAYKRWMDDIRYQGNKAVLTAREKGKPIMVLSGRPYHIDPEIGHGIDKLASSLGFVVVSEDSIWNLVEVPRVRVLNQWTYHARLYAAAKYATANKDVQLVQLVSFGCGIDAITTDEVRSILEEGGKLYTQIKIDEITNLGAVKIRLRSLIGALNERSEGNE